MLAYANYFNDARIKNYVDALLKSGYEVDVFALGEGAPAQRGLRVFSLMDKVASRRALPYLISQLAFFLRALVAVTRSRPYDLVHVHNMPDFIVYCAVFAKLRGAHIMLDIHDTMPEAYATKFDLDLSHPLIKVLRFEERLSAMFADVVITTNELHRTALIGHGIPAHKIELIMNVGNPAIFQPRTQRPHARTSLVLGYHGTVAERLGLDLIVEAVRRALPACPGLRFVVLGDGEFMPELRAQVSAAGLEDVVALRGWLPVEDLPRALDEVDVGVVGNRRRTELRQNWMLPVKMLEYAAMEIPTIAPRLRVINYYFDEQSALLYEPDDVADLARVIQAVYDDRGLLDRLRAGLREFNARYNWPGMEARYLGLAAGSRRLLRG
jgi:glycosyltransferase involved in cell wall biosynthesis